MGQQSPLKGSEGLAHPFIHSLRGVVLLLGVVCAEWSCRHRLAANGHRLASMVRMRSGSLDSVSPCIRPQAVPRGARLGRLLTGSTQPGKGAQGRYPGSVLFKQLGSSQRWGSFGRGVRGDAVAFS